MDRTNDSRHMCGDGANIYNKSLLIVEKDAGDIRMRVFGNCPVYVGDTLNCFRPSDGTLGAAVTITVKYTRVLVNGQLCEDITVSAVPISNLDVGWDNDRFFSQDYGNYDFLFDNCEVKNNRGRGFLIQASHGRITNCNFERFNGEGLWIGDEIDWDEGLLASDVWIEGNTFTRCGYSRYFILPGYSSMWSSRQAGIIRILGVEADNRAPAAQIMHDGITIKDNTITEWPRHAIYVTNARNVEITGNTLDNPGNFGTKCDDGYKSGVIFCNKVEDVDITYNDIDDSRGSSVITGHLYEKDTTSGEVTYSNNTYSTNYSGSELQTTSGF